MRCFFKFGFKFLEDKEAEDIEKLTDTDKIYLDFLK